MARNKGIYLGRGDRSIDCLSWYLSPDGRIEGYDRQELSMSMAGDCVYDLRQYMPDKVRAKAIELMPVTQKQTFLVCDGEGCPNSAVIHQAGKHFCVECALEAGIDF
jgi:hypothetical protein